MREDETTITLAAGLAVNCPACGFPTHRWSSITAYPGLIDKAIGAIFGYPVEPHTWIRMRCCGDAVTSEGEECLARQLDDLRRTP